MSILKFSVKFLTAALGALVIAAWIAPRLLISNDLERLAGGDPQAVDYAKEVHRLIGHGVCSQLGALTCTGVKIVELNPVKTQACRYPYEGKAVVYGLFGIPSHRGVIDCNTHYRLDRINKQIL